MAARDSAWRLGDSASIDAMFGALEVTTACLLRALPATRATAEIIELRTAATAVDGFDRAAVEAMTARLRARSREVTEDVHG